jgi:hypothetical protein
MAIDLINYETFDYCHSEEKIIENNIHYIVKTYSNKKIWYRNEQIHRAGDLPAIIYTNGGLEYYINNMRHRANGKCAYKTILEGNMTLAWYVEGELKRNNKPTIENISEEKYKLLKKIENFI